MIRDTHKQLMKRVERALKDMEISSLKMKGNIIAFHLIEQQKTTSKKISVLILVNNNSITIILGFPFEVRNEVFELCELRLLSFNKNMKLGRFELNYDYKLITLLYETICTDPKNKFDSVAFQCYIKTLLEEAFDKYSILEEISCG